jgi:hypothetical protein
MSAFQKIGKTRFGTHWVAAVSFEKALFPIHFLVADHTISFDVSAHIVNFHGLTPV